MNQNLAKIIEWSVWANLDRKKDLELILLKGHLIIEFLLENLLTNNGLQNCKKNSFFKKVEMLKNFSVNNTEELGKVTDHLLALNKIRNQFAHEWDFKISKSDIEGWAANVLLSYDGKKFSKYTYRTKIIHAFSALSCALVQFQQQVH